MQYSCCSAYQLTHSPSTSLASNQNAIMKLLSLKSAAAGIAAMALAGSVFAGSIAKKDIVDTASAAGSFETLLAAATAAGLVDTLKGEGPFTVFAPTDDAFAALPEGTVENLLKPENKDQLVDILTFHVVPGKVMSGDISGQELTAETVQGGELAVDATDGVVVNGATVVQADIESSNGVIHVIDAVILPPSS